MSILTRLTALATAAMVLSCGDRAPRQPTPDELARISPETFSHFDAAYADDKGCGGGEGILISTQSIGPVRLGRPLKALRERCAIAMVKVPGSLGIEGPVLAVSHGGGLILFTVAGKDSAIQTA